MKFGILFRPQDPPRAAGIVGRWREILAAAKVAEDAGFDGLFLPEHHMMPDGYLPSPWAALGALAAVTERVEIGTTIHLLPFEHPVHVGLHRLHPHLPGGHRPRLPHPDPPHGLGARPRAGARMHPPLRPRGHPRPPPSRERPPRGQRGDQ
ncbi:MAG: LLM class flavin-dependent oxidoreductase [Streptosporangiales bacterium]|nr:LLM class flavin-dependent oxidoreductase [Streptosporangiales bacterium]